MATLIIECDDELACHVEESARREHKTVSEWVKERVKPEGDRVAVLAAMERRALANGYPPAWMTLYGSLADDDSFVAPVRKNTRPTDALDEV